MTIPNASWKKVVLKKKSYGWQKNNLILEFLVKNILQNSIMVNYGDFERKKEQHLNETGFHLMEDIVILKHGIIYFAR